MGSGESQNELGQQEIGLLWKKNKDDEYTIIIDKYGNKFQRYQFQLDPKYQPSHQLRIYQQRLNIKSPIVKPYYAQFTPLDHNSFFSIKRTYLISVITQRIPHRLSMVPQLTYQECLYILIQALKGFSTIYHNTGPINPTEDMIGFNQNGEVKVWLNQNFGKNYPIKYREGLQSSRSLQGNIYKIGSKRNSLDMNNIVNMQQASFVRKIIVLVEEKCQQGRFPEKIRERFNTGCINFSEAFKIIQQNIKDLHLYIPDHIDLYENKVHISIIDHNLSFQEKANIWKGKLARQRQYLSPIIHQSKIINHYSMKPQIQQTNKNMITQSRPRSSSYLLRHLEQFKKPLSTRNNNALKQ